MRAIISALVVAVIAFGLPATGGAASNSDLYTNVYVAPPTFLNMGGSSLRDPFRDLKPPTARKTAKEILENAGITFGEGSSAIYNPANSQLIVRNTQDQMELVEAYIESIKQGVEKQIYVTIYEIQVDPDFKFGKKEEPFEGLLTLPPLPEAQEAKRAIVFDSHESFRREFSKPPAKPDEKRERIGRKIDGILSDPQFQVLIRQLRQRKDVEILNLPSVMSRSGQICMSQANDRRYGVNTVLGPDDSTIDLQIFLAPPGEALFDEWDRVTTPYKVTIGDGQTVILAERREKGTGRFVFVKAQIMDPAGMPIHRKNEKKAEKSESKKEAKAPKVWVTPGLQDVVKRADEAALLGSQLMADGDYKGAAGKFAESLNTLPKHEMTVSRREAYEKQLARAQEHFKDENIFGPGEYDIYVVAKGDTLYQIAKDMKASVGAIKRANRLKEEILLVGQDLLIPRKERGFDDHFKTIVIPKVDFGDVPLDDALGRLLVLVRKHSDRGLFPDFNPKISIEEAEKIGNPKITLRLSNVPASEALRYITSLAQCKYRVEGEVIIVVPLSK